MQKLNLAVISRKLISNLNPADLLIELARRGVKLDAAKHVLNGRAECPHCGHRGSIEKDFGVRVMRGAVWPQSWCKACRAGHH